MAPHLACGTIGVTTPTDRRTPEGATVSTQSILDWIVCVTSNLLPSQSRTLAALVAAAVRTERVNLATIGRKMAGPVAAKHTIKRAWRFTCNRRVEVARRHGRRHPASLRGGARSRCWSASTGPTSATSTP